MATASALPVPEGCIERFPVRRVLECIIQGRQFRGLGVARRKGDGQQEVGEAGILGQKRTVEISSYRVLPPHPFGAVLSVVAITRDHRPKGSCLPPEVRPPGVVLEAGYDQALACEVDFDCRRSDQSVPGTALRPDIEDPQTLPFLTIT